MWVCKCAGVMCGCPHINTTNKCLVFNVSLHAPSPPVAIETRAPVNMAAEYITLTTPTKTHHVFMNIKETFELMETLTKIAIQE